MSRIEDGTCYVVCFNSLKHIESVSGSIWSVSYTASGGLIRSSGVSLFLDLSLLVFVNFYSVGFSQAGFAFSLR